MGESRLTLQELFSGEMAMRKISRGAIINFINFPGSTSLYMRM